MEGSKSTELRRVKPRVVKGDVVLIYETSPTMALVGYGVVESVFEDTPNKLWEKVKPVAGISRTEFNQYYQGAPIGYAINFSSVENFYQSVSLPDLKSKIAGFHPPQSYRYLCQDQATSVCFA